MRQVVRIIFLLVLAIFYILIPIDLIPDRLGRFGRIDDFALLFIIIWWFFFKPLYDEIKEKSNTHSNKKTSNHRNTVESDEDVRIKSPYEILNVSKDATDKEIKDAYHQLIKKYHPDLVNTMGDEIKDVANKMTEEINKAYDEIMPEK